MHELISAFEQIDGEEPTLDRSAYLVIYSTIHDYSRCSPDSGRGRILPGEQAYHDLADILRSHCKNIRIKITQQHSEAADKDLAIMQTYAKECRRYGALAKLIAHLFGAVDRHWVTREVDEGKPGVYRIRDLHMRIWKDEVAIGNPRPDQDSDVAGTGFETILDIAMRLREMNDPTAGEDSGQQVADLLNEVFASFNEASIKTIGTWMPEQSHGLTPLDNVDPSKLKHETLPSGLKVTHFI